MDLVVVEKDRCKGCELCIGFCPKQVLELSKDINVKGYRYAQPVHKEKCISCGFCGDMCPETAIRVVKKVKAKAS